MSSTSPSAPHADELSSILGIARRPDRLSVCREWFRHPRSATRDGVLPVGCATRAKPIRNCMIDGAAVAATVAAVLRDPDPCHSPVSARYPRQRADYANVSLNSKTCDLFFMTNKENLWQPQL